jgi:hypothetical protein
MSDLDPVPDPQSGALDELRARADALERQLAEVQREAEARLIRAELKAEAVRAGMIDLDGLKLLDANALRLNQSNEVTGARELMQQLRRDKPWLFGGLSSSSAAAAPPAQAPRHKSALEMSDAEYRAARAELVKRRF